MYEAHFHLQKRPFSTTPNPDCFFASEAIQDLVDELVLRAESGQGIGILTAEAGTGKTLICRRVAAELTGRLTPIVLPNASFPTRRALLQSVLFELGRRYGGLEEQELRLAVFAALKELAIAGRGALLIVDEAHLLSDRLLEEVRMLATLSEASQPLARVILAGQPALEERMMEPALAALNQRVACHLYLESLTRQESMEYVDYRIGWAGGDSSLMFTAEALEKMAAGAGGLPRCLNQLCDHSLLLAFARDESQVTAEIVDEALLDLRQLPLHWNTPVAAESPLDPLHKSQAIDDCDVELLDEADETDLESEGLLPNVNARNAETVCIEIGGDDAECDDVAGLNDSIDLVGEADDSSAAGPLMQPEHRMHRPYGAGVVPLPDASPAALRALAEEVVVDRYAALDIGAPRLMRTFEDATVPEGWLPPCQAPLAELPAPPVIPVQIPLKPAHQPDTDDVELPLDAESHLVDVVEPEECGLEEQLETSILDACLEVQTAVGRWSDEVDIPTHSIDGSHADAARESIIPVAPDVYDVIEPEQSVRSAGITDADREDLLIADRSGDHYVPRPKYRHVFSTLRRRIGRTVRPARGD